MNMKRTPRHILTAILVGCGLAAAAPLVQSCSDDELRPESVITVDQQVYTPFDYWLQRNYVAPYNIRFKYRYEDNESDMNYYTIPSRYEDAVVLAHLVEEPFRIRSTNQSFISTDSGELTTLWKEPSSAWTKSEAPQVV